jgi:serine/threonine-protein kinase
MSEIFISYKAEDRPRAQPLVEALEAEGLSVWWDARVGGGEAWRETIAEHLDAAGCVIVLWSKRSTGPEGRFVRDEAARAQQHGTYLPVTIDKVDPPLGFGEMQALSLGGWKGDPADPRYRAVSACAHAMLGRPARIAPAASPRLRVDRRAILAGGGVAALAAATGGWLLFRPTSANADTVAVLPFANLSGDPGQSYFADGMAEEVRSALASLGSLQVVARTSSEMMRNVDTTTAARRLNVVHVITGSVRRSPSTVRVSAQLVDGESGLERWSQSFDRPFGDVLQIQSDIAASVASALSLKLGSNARTMLALGGTKNAEAQDFLLQATAIRGDDSDAGMLRRMALLDKAIALDPNYAEALARKGLQQTVWASTFAKTVEDSERGQAEALASIKRAIAIAPRMALGYTALGISYTNELEMSRSLAALQRAKALPGADSLTLINYANLLSRMGRQAEAVSTIERAISLDPLNPLSRMNKALILFYGHQYAKAIEAARWTLAIAPENVRAKGILGWSLLMLGRHGEALQELRKMPTDDYRRLVGESAIAARDGRRDDALQLIQALEKIYGDAALYQYGEMYAQLGLVDRGLAAIEAAWEKRDPGLASMQVDPFVDPLRNQPRFAAIARKVFG